MRDFKRRTGGKQAKPRPLRRSQLISPFGVGAVSDFRDDESLMCAGLDEWFGGETDIPAHLRLEEPRLQRRLGKTFFVRPPELEGEDGMRRRIPFVRFPLWHYCPHCSRMDKAGYFQDQPHCETCPSGRRRRMIPVRIVAACAEGHIQDFPFRQWINCTCESDGVARLSFRAGQSSSGLAGIHVACEACSKRRTLAGAMQAEKLRACGVSCSGSRPWFAQEKTACGHDLKGVQRGGSNVYFPVVVSSIFVPDEQSGADETILAMLENEKIWIQLTSSTENGMLDTSRVEMVAAIKNVDAGRLYALAQSKLAGAVSDQPAPVDEETFRQQEYALLRRQQENPLSELVSDWIDGDQYGAFGGFIQGVGLVRRLRETRVLCGFSRLEPKSEPGPGVQSLAFAPKTSWLPGLDVYGEGVFIEFRTDRIDAWAASAPVVTRFAPAIAALDRARAARGQPPSGAHPRQIFLHSFAHALMKELSYTCGYGSSSLRERLYVDVDHPETPMSGILVYTAAGDADGTLGGLVAQGEPNRLPLIVAEALRRSAWCSNDPVCIEGSGSTADTANLAACHSCALVPETSCENGNRLLDRATLTGSPTRPELGLLTSLLPGFVAVT